MESRFDGKSHSDEEKGRQGLSYENEPPQREDTSLGLLENMSILTSMSAAEDEQKLNIDAELEYARELLQKCSDIENSSITMDTNKENNVNVQNITANMSVPNFDFPIKTELNKEGYMNNSISEVSVAFEPNEITARSSGVSISAKRQSVNKAFHGINLSKRQRLSETAKINDEESLSGSKVAEQLSIDEARCQDRTYFMPVMNTEKQKMDFGSLSGITGEIDLSIESCAGRKVSVGQYFERKSDNIGILGNNEKVKPNLGVISETPIKTGNLLALAELAILDAELTDNDRTLIPDEIDVDENTIIDLTTIAKTVLQDVTRQPRRLVNQLLKAQKKKNPVIQDNARKETYTLLCNKESMMPTTNSNKFDEDINLEKLLENTVFVNAKNLCICIVGMTNEVNVEIINIGDRWISCTLKLIEVVGLGDTKNIELNIPPEKILLEPNGTESTKIEVKVMKMCNLICVTLNIFLSDMVAKSKWSMEHKIFIKSKQLDLDIICYSDKQELDF